MSKKVTPPEGADDVRSHKGKEADNGLDPLKYKQDGTLKSTFYNAEIEKLQEQLVLLQYWDSFEQLSAYARNPDQEHLPAWRAFNRRVGTDGSVGIFHETYLVPAGGFEAIYNNMPRFGLAAAGEHVPVARRGQSAAYRAGRTGEDVPVEPVPV